MCVFFYIVMSLVNWVKVVHDSLLITIYHPWSFDIYFLKEGIVLHKSQLIDQFVICLWGKNSPFLKCKNQRWAVFWSIAPFPCTVQISKAVSASLTPPLNSNKQTMLQMLSFAWQLILMIWMYTQINKKINKTCNLIQQKFLFKITLKKILMSFISVRYFQ